MSDLTAHSIQLAVFHPQIAPNVGNIARTCVATSTPLHLIRPLGFVLDDKQIRRSAMDYWPRLRLTVHDDDAAFFAMFSPDRCWFFDSEGTLDLFETPFEADSILCMGSETRGIDPELLKQVTHRTVRIPQSPGERCLNLATSAGVALYLAIDRVTRLREKL